MNMKVSESMYFDKEQIDEFARLRAQIESLEGVRTVGAALVQVNHATWEMTVWFATERGTFATLVPSISGAIGDRVHEVPSDYFGHEGF